MKMELRSNNVELRANEDGTMTVSGYVNKTEQLSQVLGVTKRFVEKIAKGTFQRAILNATRDINFLAEHNSKLILSSTRNQSLKLHEDDEGLFMTATITPTSWGKDYYELINSGIHRNMSFGFRTIKDSWKSIGSGLFERTIEELELMEVSVVYDPAYSQSTIAARGIDLVTEVDIPVSTIKNEEKNNMKTTHSYEQVDPKIEQRDLEVEQFRSFIEERYLTTSADGGATIPENVHNGVVKKMGEISPIFAMARKFPSVSGDLKILRETTHSDGSWVGEGQDLLEIQMNLEYVNLSQKRVGTAIRVSNQLIHDAGIDTVAYVQELLANRTVKAVEKSMLIGKTSEEFKGIVYDVTVPNYTLAATATTAQKLDKLLDLYLSVHPVFHVDACYIMSRSFFNEASKMKDANGHFYIQNSVANGKPTKTLFGAEVFVTQTLAAGTVIGEVPVIFGNIEQSYAVMIKQGPNLQMINDTNNALAGVTGFVYDSYLDGAVYNPQAIAKLTIA